MKKSLLIFILSFVLVLLVGCATKTDEAPTTKGIVTTTKEDETWILPDMTGYSADKVRETLAASPLTNYQILVKNDLEYGTGEGQYEFDKFFGYAGNSNVPGTAFQVNKKLNVYVTASTLPSSLEEFFRTNDDPSLAELYASVTLEGKDLSGSFVEKGIGEVTVTGFVDGDTTRFRDSKGNNITLRYLGVDTPESTAAFEPWGKAASKFTEDMLSSAKKIVLEADAPGQADSNGRYLGWVWYLDNNDVWHLLQLEQVLFCYTRDKADSDSTYGKIISKLGTVIQKTGRRTWGEHDPNYDYSTDPKEISIQELRTNFSNYYSRKVTITGVVALLDGSSPVIVDPETGYGIFFYIPPWMSKGAYNVQVGNVITITGVATYYGEADETDLDSMDLDLGNGSPQLTDFKEENVVLVSEGTYLDETTINAPTKLSTISPVLLDPANLSSTDLGKYCSFKNLTVTRVYEASTKSGFTVTCKDENDVEINIRVDDSHYYIAGTNEDGLATTDFVVGTKITSVTGYLAYYYGYQIGLISKTLIDFEN